MNLSRHLIDSRGNVLGRIPSDQPGYRDDVAAFPERSVRRRHHRLSGRCLGTPYGSSASFLSASTSIILYDWSRSLGRFAGRPEDPRRTFRQRIRQRRPSEGRQVCPGRWWRYSTGTTVTDGKVETPIHFPCYARMFERSSRPGPQIRRRVREWVSSSRTSRSCFTVGSEWIVEDASSGDLKRSARRPITSEVRLLPGGYSSRRRMGGPSSNRGARNLIRISNVFMSWGDSQIHINNSLPPKGQCCTTDKDPYLVL